MDNLWSLHWFISLKTLREELLELSPLDQGALRRGHVMRRLQLSQGAPRQLVLCQIRQLLAALRAIDPGRFIHLLVDVLHLLEGSHLRAKRVVGRARTGKEHGRWLLPKTIWDLHSANGCL